AAHWTYTLSLHDALPILVTGTAGRYGEGHAWVTFEKEGKTFLLEPLARHLGLVLPRLSTLRYRPEFSVAWDGTANSGRYRRVERDRKSTRLNSSHVAISY